MSKYSVVFLIGCLLVLTMSGVPFAHPAAARSATPATDAAVRLTAVADAMLDSATRDTNYGGLGAFEVAHAATGERVALVRFDLSALPSDAIIDAATLRLYQMEASGASPVTLSVYFVTSDWAENTVTWNTPLTAEPIGLAASLDSVLGVYKTWDVTTYARSWLDDATGNHGLLIRGPFSGADYGRVFESREPTEQMPELAITYHLPPYQFTGRVYEGSPPDTTTPMAGIAVGLWGDEDQWPEAGFARTLLTTTVTAEDGAFGLTWYPDASWPYLHVIEEDPEGAISTGAEVAMPGAVTNFNVVTYQDLTTAGSYGGITYWDQWPLPDLVMATLVASPDLAYPEESVLLTALVQNNGPGTVNGVPVRFSTEAEVLGTRTIASIPEGEGRSVTLTYVFSTTGVVDVVAEANPDQLLAESNYANNAATAPVLLTLEKEAPFSRAELGLFALSFAPQRPDGGESVVVEALLENLSGNPVPSTNLVLWVDDEVVDETPLDDIGAYEARPVALTWPTAAPGRHLLQMVIDPEEQLPERNRDNNRLVGWIRVGGEPDPLPDLAVTDIRSDLPALNEGDSTTIAVEVCNRGYADAAQVPVLISLDGYEIAFPTIPDLPQNTCEVVTAVWEDATAGQHVLDAWIDPQNQLADDSVAARVSDTVVVSGPQYALSGPSVPTRWQRIGPNVQGPSDNVGRIDDIAISHQDPQRMVVAAPAGGVWLTNDGGQSWTPVADHLNSPNFSTVAFDPQNDSIIYAGTGSSLYHGGTGLYKSVDSGAHWTTFAGLDVAAGYGPILLTYTHPSTLTILAATDTGIWLWEGPPTVMSTTHANLRFTNVWSQTVAGRSDSVVDMLLTPETMPHVYASIQGDSVYSATLSDPTTWTRIHSGLPTGTGTNAAGTATLANSPAAPSRIYAALKRPNSDLEIYRLDPPSSTWTLKIASQSTFGPGNRFNAFIAAHPTHPEVLYVGGVRGYRLKDDGSNIVYAIPRGTASQSYLGPVHDDYKAYAFHPSAPNTVFFTTDGGVYRCTNNTGVMTCVALNDGLDVTMFYDIETAPTMTNRILGGTQDNGNAMTDDASSWDYANLGGDGRFVAIDPDNEDKMYGQDEGVRVHRTVNAGLKWDRASAGLPPGAQDHYMVIDPDDGATLLLARGPVYRTVNSGTQWDAIGPDPAFPNGAVHRIAIDPLNDRYYAGTDRGRIWAVSATQAITTNWSVIFTQAANQQVRNLLVDPDNANVLYATFAGDVISRVVRLDHTGGWPGTWAPTDLTGNLATTGRKLNGPAPGTLQWDIVRGLVKDPNAEILYIGTDRGVYQGREVGGSWQWLPDTCGLPLTYVSDLEIAASETLVRAATYGRGAFQRSLFSTNPSADAYDISTRNDTPATASTLPVTVATNLLMPGLQVNDLTLDRLNDIDYFTAQLPVAERNGQVECLAGTPAPGTDCDQGQFGIVVYAPDTPDPFEVRVYRPDGSLYKEFAAKSNLGYTIECPHSVFPDGKVTFSVRSSTGCQSRYNLWLYYSRYLCRIDPPELLYDPPLFKRFVPELGDLLWVFPADPSVINQGFVGQGLGALPDQRLIFHWDQTGDFSAAVNLLSPGNLGATLLDAAGSPVSGAGTASSTSPAAPAVAAPDLPAGWYAIDISGTSFPTYFEVTFGPKVRDIFLPIVLRH